MESNYWIEFEKESPNEYGKFIICRKDGKIHLETWNGTGWAYNHSEIRFWAKLTNPSPKLHENARTAFARSGNTML